MSQFTREALEAIASLAMNIQGSLEFSVMTPDQQDALLDQIEEAFRKSLGDAGRSFVPIREDDPTFEIIEERLHLADAFVVRWDGIFVRLKGESTPYLRIDDPFKFILRIKSVLWEEAWIRSDYRFVLQPMDMLNPIAVQTLLRANLAIYQLHNMKFGQGELRLKMLISFSRDPFLAFLDRVLTNFGRLVLTQSDGEKFTLGVAYHHNPFNPLILGEFTLSQGESIEEVVRLRMGDILTAHMLG